MKTIGIIGGVGPSTTAAFYMRLIALVKQMYNKRPAVIIHSIPVPLGAEERFLRTGEGIEDYVPLLLSAAVSLQKAGADMVVMPCNSLHHLEQEIRSIIEIPFISIVDAVVQHLKRKRVQCIGILGAPLTMEGSLYREALQEEGVESIVPFADDRTVLSTIIRNIVFGEKEADDEAKFMQVMHNVNRRGAGHLLFACSDLQEMRSRHPECVVHDSMEILAQAVCGELPVFTGSDYGFYVTEEHGDEDEAE